MTKIDIFSGFLGAGKTTLIRKLIAEGYKNEKLVLIENEFGEIAIDGGFLKDAGVQITEMNSGCICCTLVGDFTKALKKVMEEYAPDRIIIEPSGVGKLSDVAHAVEQVEGAHIGTKVTVVDAGKCRMYMRNFGEFFNDQVENADLIVMSRTDTASAEKILAATELLKQLNAKAGLISTPWDKLSGEQIVEAMEHNALHEELEHMEHEHHHEHEHDHEHHHHDHDEHDEHCTCGCHNHDHDDDEHEHHHDHDHEEHDHHEHEEHDHDHESHGHIHHHHHHHHDGSCSCGHDHDADEIFESWGAETPRKYTEEEVTGALAGLDEGEKYGIVLRAKGIVPCTDGSWIHFDYVPGEQNIRRGPAGITGRLCVIGSELKEHDLDHLFCLD